MGNFIDLVKTRRSVRSFDGNGIEPQLLNELKSYAEESTNPYDIKVRFEFLDAAANGLSSPVITGEKNYVSAVVSKVDHAEEAYGYSFQKLFSLAFFPFQLVIFGCKIIFHKNSVSFDRLQLWIYHIIE